MMLPIVWNKFGLQLLGALLKSKTLNAEYCPDNIFTALLPTHVPEASSIE
jgi:hypothetical protein